MRSAQRKTKTKFSLADKDPRVLELLTTTDHKVLGRWARDCAERVLHFFENAYSNDERPRAALETLQTWIDTGVFRMAEIRGASLAAHAAARDVGADTPARAAARAAGQAVATAHVRTHAIGPANYAAQAIFRAVPSDRAAAAIAKEREWQFRRLVRLRENKGKRRVS